MQLYMNMFGSTSNILDVPQNIEVLFFSSKDIDLSANKLSDSDIVQARSFLGTGGNLNPIRGFKDRKYFHTFPRRGFAASIFGQTLRSLLSSSNYAIGQYTSNGSNTYATVGDSLSRNRTDSADRRSIYAPLILNPNKFTSFYLPRVSLTTTTRSNYFGVYYFLPENNSESVYSYNPPQGSSNLGVETSGVSYLVAPVRTYVTSGYYYYDDTLGDGLCYSQTNTAEAESVSLDYALSMDGRIYFKDIDYVIDSEVPGTRPTIQGKSKIDFKKFII